MAELFGNYNEGVASPDAIVKLRERQAVFGTPQDKVAVYQNHALDSASVGHLVFLIIGPTKTHKAAPDRAPDGPYGAGWRYLHVGFLDLELNQLEKTDG